VAASGKSIISTTSADPYVPVHNASHHQPDMTKTKKMSYGDMEGLFCSVLWPDELRQHELSMDLELVKKKIMSRDKNRTFRKSFGHNCRAQNPKKSLNSKTLWKTLITETSNLSSFLPEKKGNKKLWKTIQSQNFKPLFQFYQRRKTALWKTIVTELKTSPPILPKKKENTLETRQPQNSKNLLQFYQRRKQQICLILPMRQIQLWREMI
jgi:hypothetical protein